MKGKETDIEKESEKGKRKGIEKNLLCKKIERGETERYISDEDR